MSLNEVLKGKNANECIESFAKNFDSFCTNKDFAFLPPDLIEKILQNPNLKYGKDEKTTQYFLTLFSRDDGLAQYFSDYVPFDKMHHSSLIPLKDKLFELGLIQESKRFERIISMKKQIEEKTEECENLEKNLDNCIKSLDKSTNQLGETTKLAEKIADSVAERNKELDELDEKIKEEETKFKKLQKKLMGSKR